MFIFKLSDNNLNSCLFLIMFILKVHTGKDTNITLVYLFLSAVKLQIIICTNLSLEGQRKTIGKRIKVQRKKYQNKSWIDIFLQHLSSALFCWMTGLNHFRTMWQRTSETKKLRKQRKLIKRFEVFFNLLEKRQQQQKTDDLWSKSPEQPAK